jgi:large subunit ribosomal protein L3
MARALLGRKVQMTQVFADNGDVIPVTVVEAGPCPVTMIKTPERDGYSAFQIGFDEMRKNVTKPMRGHFKRAKTAPQRHLREVRFDGGDAPVELGQELTVGVFEVGDIVDVVGTMKGKGFQGTIKRHGFARGPMSHGSMNVRRPGSIGQASTPSRVMKGLKMGGRMGGKRSTTKNLEVVRIDAGGNLLFIRGSVPGPNGGLVFVQDAVTGASPEQRSRPIPKNDADGGEE